MKDEVPLHHQAKEASDGQPLFKGNCDHRHLLLGPAKAGPLECTMWAGPRA